ncbi:MAG: TonB-dependent receptor [Pseudomonadota bacterium]
MAIFKKSNVSCSAKLILLASSCLSFVGGQAAAQEDDDGDVLIITGSRIQRTDLESTSPISILDREALDISGFNAVQDVLNELPQTGVPGLTDTNSNFSTIGGGVNNVNLRNLGSNRTLVLVNGRRHIGGIAGSPVVDLNMIPAPLVDRIDVVTGGASAVYGSEALAGVINIVMKDDFEGVELNARYGGTTEGGATEVDYSITAGANFDGDRGNAVVYLGYSDRGALNARDRAISESDAVNSSFGPFGAIGIPGGGFVTLDRSTGLFDKPFVNAEDGFDRNAVRLIRIPTERVQFNSNLTYEVNDRITVFSESSYANVGSEQQLEPTIIGQFISVGSVPNINMPVDNPFLPQETRDLILAGDPMATEVTFRRRFTELGPRSTETQRQIFRTLLGIRGELPDIFGNLDYELYYQWGRLTRDQVNGGIANTLNVFNALRTEPDGDGGFQCVDEISRSLGCVPVNFFGADTVTGPALDFISTTAQTTARATQEVFAGTVTGDLTELPAGPVGFAAGFEYRQEESAFTSDALAQTGLTTNNTTPSVAGGYEVTEGFLEVNVPLVAEQPLVHFFGVEGAFRYADYTTIGSTTAWKLAGTWKPVPELAIRGGFNTAVRAPFINELFNPGSETFRNYIDPCNFGGAGGTSADGRTVYDAETPEVQARCATIPGTATLDQGAQNIFSAGGLAAGNPDLDEETAETFTVGAVYSPEFIPNLNLTVDYYSITVEDAIASFSAQDTVDQCVRQPDFPNNPFCSLISRNPTSGLVERIDALAINVAQFEAEGVDFAADYSFSAGEVDLRANVTGNYRLAETRLPFEGGTQLDDEGEVGSQTWSVNGSLVADWRQIRAAWSMRYIGGVNIDNENPNAGPADAGGEIDPFLYHEINIAYQLNDQFELQFGVNNLFDEEPPFLGQGVNGDVVGTNTAADVYDALGRFAYVGLRARF